MMTQNMMQRAGRRESKHGFSLIEMMVSICIFMMLMIVMMQTTEQITRAWKASSLKIEEFQGSRAAFETITRRLRQATLNTYWDYFDASGKPRVPYEVDSAKYNNFVADHYGRQSELHFITARAATLLNGAASHFPTQAIFFQAPLGYTGNEKTYGGMDNALAACGYYVQFDQDSKYPSFLSSMNTAKRYRYRLKQFLQPVEQNTIFSGFDPVNPTVNQNVWFTAPLASSSPPVQILADNIIALVCLPMLPLAEDENGTALAPALNFDSRKAVTFTTNPPGNTPGYTDITFNQLPPLMRVVMVAVDETFAARQNPPNDSSPPAFVPASLFQAASALDADIKTLTDTLDTYPNVHYRVFDTSISLRNAKWSRQPKQ
jgi:uncharacterized protein (TIGR02599 family)